MIKIVRLKFFEFLEQFNFVEMLGFFKKLILAIVIVIAVSNLRLFVDLISSYNYIVIKSLLAYVIVFKINYSDPRTKKVLKGIFSIDFGQDRVKKDKTDLFVDTLFKWDLSMKTLTQSFWITQKEYMNLVKILKTENVVINNKNQNNRLELVKNIAKSDIYNALLNTAL